MNEQVEQDVDRMAGQVDQGDAGGGAELPAEQEPTGQDGKAGIVIDELGA